MIYKILWRTQTIQARPNASKYKTNSWKDNNIIYTDGERYN